MDRTHFGCAQLCIDIMQGHAYVCGTLGLVLMHNADYNCEIIVCNAGGKLWGFGTYVSCDVLIHMFNKGYVVHS